MREALRRHWPEYLIEAAGLGVFMISACLFATLLEHPGSPVRQAVSDPLLRRLLMGLAMGATAVAIIYSPWGKQSGAHINPAVTLSFFRLGKVRPWDAVFYVAAQFVGALLGVVLAAVLLRGALADPSVGYVVTRPGTGGVWLAFVAEAVISFLLMLVILIVSNQPDRIARLTGLCAGVLVAAYITLEAPLSGMSMNPARSMGSALPARVFTDLWIYFTAPPLGMLLAAQAYLAGAGARRVHCAKLHHQNDKRCIFCGSGVKDEAWAESAPARDTSPWSEDDVGSLTTSQSSRKRSSQGSMP
jgi:aquaporin Z